MKRVAHGAVGTWQVKGSFPSPASGQHHSGQTGAWARARRRKGRGGGRGERLPGEAPCLSAAGPAPGSGARELFFVSIPSLGKHSRRCAAGGDTMGLLCSPAEATRIFHGPPTVTQR